MEIKEFFSTYRDEICEAYSERVKNAKSKKDFADMLDINVCDWLCKMNGKHRDVGSFIGENFGNFINGRFFNIVETEYGDYSCGLCVGQYLQTETLLSNDITCFIDSNIQKLTLAKNNIRTIICSNRLLSQKLQKTRNCLSKKTTLQLLSLTRSLKTE